MIEAIKASILRIPFTETFKHASAERSETHAIWVEAHGPGGAIGHGEGCPRDYVTGENLQTANRFIDARIDEWRSAITSVNALQRWAAAHSAEIDSHPAAWTAVELALLDLFGSQHNQPVEALLGLPKLSGRFAYTAVIGDGSPEKFSAQLKTYLKAGFRQFKVKLSGDRERDLGKVAALSESGVPSEHVRADANNLWRRAEEVVEHVSSLGYPFFALEEPLAPGDYAGLSKVAADLECGIVLDESLLRKEQLPQLDDRTRWIANVRVSKMGGLLRSLALVEEAAKRRLAIIVGAHVGETSILTRAALTVAQAADREGLLVGQEGAFGTHLLQCDVTDPPLMFGAGGILDAERMGAGQDPGWGLRISRSMR
jgi:L-Ala-D/L-Glu epimerase